MSHQRKVDRPAKPQMVSRVIELREAVVAARAAGKTIGLVPTMGALHAGHLSLVRAARAECDYTIVTIFVNPTQFAPTEDFDKYPRTLEKDLELLQQVGTDLVFAPDRDAIYPEGFSTFVGTPDVGKPLEGRCRPGHFDGVTTVVLKLFNLAQADVAYFGQKDYQQAAVIQRMVADLDVPIIIRVCPIVREPDGLAMSSRNRYLDTAQRTRSLALWRCLSAAQSLLAEGQTDATIIVDRMKQILTDMGVTKIDYAVLADPDTLQPIDQVRGPAIALVAAYVDQTRLIDNLRLES